MATETFSFEEASGADFPKLVPAKRTRLEEIVNPAEVISSMGDAVDPKKIQSLFTDIAGRHKATITSMVRPIINKGAGARSQHPHGTAADFRTKDKTPEEVEAKKRIDAKLADKTNAMKLANEVEQKFNPFFIKLAQDETTRINATLPVSKHRKFLEGKGWKTQLKDKPGQVSVTSEEDAIEWLEANEPTAVRIVKTVDLSRVASESVVSKLEQLGKKLTKFGFSLIEKLPDGNSTVKIKDFDSQS